MNKKILLILMLLFIPSVSAESKFIDSETKNNFTVSWYLIKDGLRNIEYDIYVTNLEDEKRQINLSSIFEPQKYRSQEIENIKFLEYEEKNDVNTGVKYYILSKSKPIFRDTTPQYKKEYYDTQTIGKLETKVYKLVFTVPLIKNEYFYGSKTKILLGVGEETYHPWLNISWFSRLYLYNVNPTYSSNTTIQISIDTRSLYLQQGVKEDCTDIRVTDGDNVELNYRLGSGCLTQNTTLDIEFTLNMSSLYIYYNNPGALNVSNSSVVLPEAGIPTTIIDYSGYGNDGINNGTIYNDSGYDNGTALNFDGINDYINIPIDISITANPNGSVSLWFYFTPDGNADVLYDLSDSGDADSRFVFQVLDNVGDELQLRLNDGITDYIIVTTDDGITPNAWNHLVITGGIAGNALYVNGVPSAVSYNIGNSSSINWFVTVNDVDFIALGVEKKSGGFVSYANGSIDDVRIYNRSISANEVLNLYNGTDPINNTQLVAYWPINIINVTPSFSFESQQYSPFFASEKTYEGIWTLPFTAPAKSSIYDIKVDLDDCNFNEFDLNTNTFRFYGNVSRGICAFDKCLAKIWDVCLTDKVNATTICKPIIDKMDIGKTAIRYGIYIRGSSLGSYIFKPGEFIYKSDRLIDRVWLLSYPKELNFTSNCVDNDIRIQYQTDAVIQSAEESQSTVTDEGLFGLLKSLKDGLVNLISVSWDIVAFGFTIIIFIITNIWLVIILFEIFAMIYALRSTYTISEFLRAYINAHTKGIELTIKVLELLFSFIQRIISAIVNLVPFT